MAQADTSESYILIIGAMKSGTTTLFDMLAEHPQIAPCDPKEPGFFAFEEKWALGYPWYHGLFAYEPAKHRYRLDGSTDYAKYPYCDGVPERLAASAPRKFKLIYIMRHPLRRIESHARHVQLTKREIGSQESSIADHGLESGISPVNLALSRYAMQLSRYDTFSESGDLMALTLEQLNEAPERTLQEILAFLDLPAVSLNLSPKNVADQKHRMPAFWRAILGSNATSIGKALLPKHTREAIKARLRKPVRAEGRFNLTASEESRLLEDLSDDLRDLRDRYGIDTKRWWGV